MVRPILPPTTMTTPTRKRVVRSRRTPSTPSSSCWRSDATEVGTRATAAAAADPGRRAWMRGRRRSGARRTARSSGRPN